jgi:hypothetical protein
LRDRALVAPLVEGIGLVQFKVRGHVGMYGARFIFVGGLTVR